MRKDAPFLSLSVGLAAGIVVSDHLVVAHVLWLRVLALASLFVLLGIHLNWFRGYGAFFNGLYVVLSHLFVAYVGVELSWAYDQTSKAEKYQSEEAVTLLLRLSESPEKTQNGYRLRGTVLAIKEDASWTELGLKALIYTKNDEHLKNVRRGDDMIGKARIRIPEGERLPGTFNNRRHLKYQGIYYSFYVPHMQVYRKESRWDLLSRAQAVQSEVAVWFDHHCKDSINAGILKALVLGERSGVDRELSDKFSKIGVIHVLAVSGLHVGIMYLVFGLLFFPLKRLPGGAVIYTLLLLLALWAYAFITGLAPSVSRSALMFSIVLIGKAIGRKHFTYNTIAFSAFLLMLWSPGIIYQLGFQLSYAAVLGIVAIALPLQRRLKTGDWLLDKVIALILVSFAAQMGTLPLTLYYFGQFPNLFLISNLFVIPLITIVLYAALLAVVSGLAGLKFGSLYFLDLSEMYLHAIRGLTDHLLQTSFAWTEGLYLQFWDMMCLYLVMLFAYQIIRTSSPKFVIPALVVGMFWLFNNEYTKKDSSQTKFYTLHAGGNDSMYLWTREHTAFCLVPLNVYANGSYAGTLIQQHAKRFGFDLEWIPFEMALDHRYIDQKGFYATGNGLIQIFGHHYQVKSHRRGQSVLMALDKP